ncbi:hypothetical protein Q0F98_05820 [Paenibacillus amylolyticus]|nr:hypothetical protein Q0F98_05820 [Paenibacillus amylolyticus]
MRLTEIAQMYMMDTTPKYSYDPTTTQLNDGVYIYRMAPFTEQNIHGGVWFPDVDIHQSYENCRSNSKILPAVRIVEEMIANRGINSTTPEIDAIFSLLHEEGHWMQYLEEYVEQNKSGEDYLKDSEQFSREMGILDLQIKARTDHNLYYDYHKLYREHPFEKFADNYAINKMISLGLK